MTNDSPCTNNCGLDTSNILCLGCYRTTDEIEKWSNLSKLERDWINVQIKWRKVAWQTGMETEK